MQDFQTEIVHLRRLLRQEFGLRGATLADQIRYGGRLLPRKVRAAARRLAEAEGMVAAPKLAKQLDWHRLGEDRILCHDYLQRRAQGRAHPLWLRVASWAALIVVVSAGVIASLIFLRAKF